MDLSRFTTGQRIAGAGGLLLFISLFLPWYALSGANYGADFGNQSGLAWESTLDLYLLITVGIAFACTFGVGRGVLIPGVSTGGATALLGGIGFFLLLWRLVFDFPAGGGRMVGIFFALIATAVVLVGGLRCNAEDQARGWDDTY